MRLFADTSFYVAVVSQRDALHDRAMDAMKEFQGRIVTTEYVLVEVGNWLAATGERPTFVLLNQKAHSDPKTLVIAADRGLYDAGVNLYASRLDKQWSVTDCISFVVMRQYRLTEALTADRHFQQAGFKAVLSGSH